jgi:hypothetical protein
MKIIKVILSSIVFLSLWVFPIMNAFAKDKPDSLEFRIKLEKETFLLYEPIWIDLYMTNLGEEKVDIKPLTTASQWLKIILVNSSNDTIPYKGELTGWVGWGPTFTVESKETLYICRDILEGTDFGVLEKPMSLWGRSYLKPDTYKIIAIYKRHLTSNELDFTVLNPTGNEENALRMWKEGYAYQLKKKLNSSIEKWKELIDNYPESAYTASALRALCYYDKQNSIKHAEMLLSTNPNSGYSHYAIGILLEDKSEEEKEKIYQEIEQKYSGMRAEKLAKNIKNGIIAY